MRPFARSELANPNNARFMQHIEHREDAPVERAASAPAALPPSVDPDVQERMLELNRKAADTELGIYGHCLLLVRRQTSSILAAAMGTSYFVRTGELIQWAVRADASTRKQWSDGTCWDLAEMFGPDWVAGSWHRDEAWWIASLHQ
jgi:hypothetical protein